MSEGTTDNPVPDGMVRLTIDGREVTVPKGQLIIRAAEDMGIMIPRFCDHPLLDPAGACRQCVVEVEGQRKPMMACTTECGDGWEVKTHHTSEVARKAQAGTMEFLLINHPLDCPMCDKGGECPLQDQALAYGNNESRFVDEKRRYDKPVAVSPLVLLDRERCVLCARCTRFSEQISGDPFIELFERGALEQVAIYEDEPYHSYFSGNVIQICPVGALTSADYRFKARPFDIRSAPSVCDGCAGGCNQTVQSRRGEIQRQLARTNMAVNEMWNCDKGRFAFPYLTSQLRIEEPRMRDSHLDLSPASWSQALVGATAAIKDRRTAIIVGSRVPDEDAYAIAKYAKSVLGTDDVDFRTSGTDTADTEALRALVGRDTATYADVEAAPVAIVVGLDPREQAPMLFLRLRKAWRNHGSKLVPVGPRMASLAEFAWRRVGTGVDGIAAGVAGLAAAAGAPISAPNDTNAAAMAEIVEAAKAGPAPAVVLVGSRAGADALAAAGHLADALGAKLAWVPEAAGARGALAAGLAPGLLPGGRSLADEADRAAVAEVWGAEPAATEPGRGLTQILEACAAGEIDVLHLIGIDLVREAPDAALAEKALDEVRTVIVQDLVRSDTYDVADVVLPATATQERTGTFTDWEGRPQRFQQAVDAPGAVQDHWEIMVQLAALLGADLGFNDLDGIRREMAELAPGAPNAFPTPEVGATSGTSGEGLALFTSPALLDRDLTLTDAVHVNATALPAVAAINVADAVAAGIADGDAVEISDGTTTIAMTAAVERDIVAGAVWIPRNSTAVHAGRLRGGRVTVAKAAAADAAAAPSAEVPA